MYHYHQPFRLLIATLTLLLLLGVPANAQLQTSTGQSKANRIQAAMGTAFTYQGRLSEGETPVDGTYDFVFRLFDAASGGSQVGSAIIVDDVTMTDGLFTADLDFGDVFNGAALWLEIGVRPGSSNSTTTTLKPRQALTATPYAQYAQEVGTHDHFGETWEGTSGLAGLRVEHDLTSGENYGIMGQTDSTSGVGVYGYARATLGVNYGVRGESDSQDGIGVHGIGELTGVLGESGSGYGLRGETSSSNYAGVYALGHGSDADLILGGRSAVDDDGILYSDPSYDSSDLFLVAHDGVRIDLDNDGDGEDADFTIVDKDNTIIFNVDESGDVYVAGNVSKGGGSFKIDHPLDPENRYLYHAFVESPDMKNIYDGVAVLNEDGAAQVTLPDWFEALNKEFRYQLTPIGAPMPNLYIAQEVKDNAFAIAGGEPGKKVSWQVTGIRHDPYAEAYRIPVEEAKTAEERGTYLHPELYEQP